MRHALLSTKHLYAWHCYRQSSRQNLKIINFMLELHLYMHHLSYPPHSSLSSTVSRFKCTHTQHLQIGFRDVYAKFMTHIRTRRNKDIWGHTDLITYEASCESSICTLIIYFYSELFWFRKLQPNIVHLIHTFFIVSLLLHALLIYFNWIQLSLSWHERYFKIVHSVVFFLDFFAPIPYPARF